MFGKDTNASQSSTNAAGLQKLAKSGDVQKLMSLLEEKGSVKEAAKSASKGDASALVGMVQQLMSSAEGAHLIESIQQKAKEAGIERNGAES